MIQVLICCHTRLPLPRRSDEEDDAAPPPPGFTMQTKAIHNDGACHADPDAEGTKADSDPDFVDGQEEQLQSLPPMLPMYALPFLFLAMHVDQRLCL